MAADIFCALLPLFLVLVYLAAVGLVTLWSIYDIGKRMVVVSATHPNSR